MAVAVAVLLLIGRDAAAWIVAVVLLLFIAATFLPTSSRERGMSARNRDY